MYRCHRSVKEELNRTLDIIRFLHNRNQNEHENLLREKEIIYRKKKALNENKLTSNQELVFYFTFLWATIVTGYLCSNDGNFTDGVFWKYFFPAWLAFIATQFVILNVNRRSKIMEANKKTNVAIEKLSRIHALASETSVGYRENYNSPVLREIASISKNEKQTK